MVLIQKWPFFQLSFLGNTGKENVFYDILEQNNAFLGCKNKRFRKSKSWHFFKGFRSKNRHLSNILFWAIYARKMSFTIFYNEKAPFKAIKTRRSKNRKTEIYPKGVKPWFLCKNDHIFNFFFFRQNRRGKYLLRYSKRKKCLSRL